VGAGYGFRISEVLEKLLPEYEHLNFGGIGQSVVGSEKDLEDFLNLIKKFKLDKAVYLMNLNDIVREKAGSIEKEGFGRLKRYWKQLFDGLRGRSYLYTFVRNTLKNQLLRLGYGVHGQLSYEMFPEKYAEVLKSNALRINYLNEALSELGVELIVVILPYEMQISKSAEIEYAKQGIRWEGETFINRGPQKQILKYLAPEVNILDAYYAFVGADADIEKQREQNALGECFVYNLGGRLDWNHPNREGHRLIAEYIYKSKILVDALNEDRHTDK
jgi:hypothetical protein